MTCTPNNQNIEHMAKINLQGMEFYAYHGYYEEERIIGNYYILDIELDNSSDMAERADDLGGTVNYETVYQICKFEMRKSSQLLEHVARRILDKIKDQFPVLSSVKVRITKKNPPMGGVIDAVSIELSSDGGGLDSFGLG